MDKSINSSFYDEKYYTSSNYSNYLDRSERYHSLASELFDAMSKLGLVFKDDVILDYGCALGFLMEGISTLGYRNVCGYDVSEWAHERAKQKGLLILDGPSPCDVMIALDVFEHMEDLEITKAILACSPRVLVGRIPCADFGESSFYLNVSRQDPTHINCKDKNKWVDLIRYCGYCTIMPLSLHTIWDSKGVMSFVAIKDPVYYTWDKPNGRFA